jgi:hypothetical protein
MIPEMTSYADVVREAQGQHLSLRLLNSQGKTVVANYIGVGEIVGASEVVVDARVDFKSFFSPSGQAHDWSIHHLGGLLVEGLISGSYGNNDAGVSLGNAETLRGSELERLIAWLEKLEGDPVILLPHHRGRLSPLAV